MIDLLLITDVPRLRKVFLRLADERNVRLRVATSLEKGSEELVADKPAMVFVQTHLSGLSADILLKHLKKQLGRRRTRFVLLSPPDQVGEEVLKLYNDHIDTTLDDQLLFEALGVLISKPAPKKKKETVSAPEKPEVPAAVEMQPSPVESLAAEAQTAGGSDLAQPLRHEAEPHLLTQLSPHAAEAAEPTLEEQGLVYTPRTQLSVYSEFTSAFDSAVGNISPNGEPSAESRPEQPFADTHGQPETSRKPVRPKNRYMLLLWLVPVLLAAVGVTILQHRGSQDAQVDLKPVAPPLPAAKSAPAAVTAAVVTPKAPPPVVQPQAIPAAKPSAAVSNARPVERVVPSAIAGKLEPKAAASPAVPVKGRPVALPEFIPRYGLDKGYAVANPGWERYMGQVTEFKVYREGGAIKAIQVVDRGGRGVPEDFMQAALRHVAKKPALAPTSSEKKDGYEIQRGQIADNLKVVYYRDAEGGRLRAFVLTWQ